MFRVYSEVEANVFVNDMKCHMRTESDVMEMFEQLRKLVQSFFDEEICD